MRLRCHARAAEHNNGCVLRRENTTGSTQKEFWRPVRMHAIAELDVVAKGITNESRRIIIMTCKKHLKVPSWVCSADPSILQVVLLCFSVNIVSHTSEWGGLARVMIRILPFVQGRQRSYWAFCRFQNDEKWFIETNNIQVIAWVAPGPKGSEGISTVINSAQIHVTPWSSSQVRIKASQTMCVRTSKIWTGLDSHGC